MKHGNHDGTGVDRHLHDPLQDRLIPLEPLDLNRVRSIDDLVRAMAKTAFTGRQLGEAADVLEAMARDKDCFVVMTLAGAMTVAKQGLIIAELIDRGVVNAIVSTGALMAHGLVEATGRAHFRYNPDVSDTELYEQGYNRVYDTLEPEKNLDDVEQVMFHVLEDWDPNEVLCSYKLNRQIGEHLSKNAKGQRGILKSAFEKGVPVFVPAFTNLGSTWPSQTGCVKALAATSCALIHLKTSNISPLPCSAKSGSGFLLLAEAFPATGPSNSAPSSNCGIVAWARMFRSSAITTACGFVRNQCIGAGFQEAPTARRSRGESLCLRPKVADLGKFSWMRQSDCR